MTKYVTATDQRWEATEVRGVAMEKCPLWAGKHHVRSTLYRMLKGTQLPSHQHAYWVQVFVISGQMQVEAVGRRRTPLRRAKTIPLNLGKRTSKRRWKIRSSWSWRRKAREACANSPEHAGVGGSPFPDVRWSSPRHNIMALAHFW